VLLLIVVELMFIPYQANCQLCLCRVYKSSIPSGRRTNCCLLFRVSFSDLTLLQ